RMEPRSNAHIHYRRRQLDDIQYVGRNQHRRLRWRMPVHNGGCRTVLKELPETDAEGGGNHHSKSTGDRHRLHVWSRRVSHDSGHGLVKFEVPKASALYGHFPTITLIAAQPSLPRSSFS